MFIRLIRHIVNFLTKRRNVSSAGYQVVHPDGRTFSK
jgi:hypothetical protein